MTARLLSYPLILVLTGLSCLAMLIPALHALVIEDHSVAQAFFYSSVLGLVLVLTVAMAMSGRKRPDNSDIENLASLFLAYTILPLFLALPFYEGLETTSFLNAYVEMVSSLTTTGATLFDRPERLVDSLHLWRGIVGWLGGLLIWVSASAVLASMYLGGFEITVSSEPGQSDLRTARFERASSARRLAQVTKELAPIYLGLTGALWVMLLISGDAPMTAAVHAMSTMSTSGISSVGGVDQATSGFAGEAVIFLFMLFALSRLTFSTDTMNTTRASLLKDPEFRIGMALVIGVPLLLFSRHWLAAFEVDEVESFSDAINALWGGMFTVLSFLSTTGFESASWTTARDWSGLGTPGLVLLGLAILGGGVATTAGGVKLLRVYALYLNGQREMERLIHPSSVGRVSSFSRRIRKRGAFIAWIFFMLFALSLAIVTMVMAALGQDLESALVLTIAALATAGPLTQAAADTPIALIEMSTAAKLVFSAAMVVGRMETLAIIALFNPGLWRD
ncbi:TrkH family potassium uptake protein [Roseovarius phycicola]|uniref:Potassium transporter TrkG n=1 Tax=Roseovarius phycicola TaxID=3080976 RepID=A0ABZ2HIT1_9RHOB